MSLSSVSDLSSSIRLRLLNADLKARASQLGEEIATGQPKDVAKHLGGNLAKLSAINHSIKLTDIYKSTGAELATRANAVQSALQIIQDSISSTGAKMLAAANTATESAIKSAASSASENLHIAVGSLNTQLAGQSLFSGQAFKSTALKPAEEILDDIAALVVGAASAGDVEILIDSYFFQPGGAFETTTYLGSNQSAGPVRISETDSAEISISARDTEIRAVLASLATAAVLSRGVLAGNQTERSNLLKSSGESMLTASEGIINIQAELGGVEERLELVQTHEIARKTSLQLTLNELIGIDSYSTATKLQATETNLEALYIMTSRLSQLSLTRFL